MASLGHVAVGLAAGRAFSRDPALAKKAAIAFSVLSMWPDVDVVGFAFGVRYADPFGHRGATHSIAIALVCGALAYVLAARRDLPRIRTTVFATVVAVSHGLLDTMTYGGGLGVALAWPFSLTRFWAPFRPIPVAPIGLGILSPLGIKVMITELFLFAPFWIYAFLPRRRAD